MITKIQYNTQAFWKGIQEGSTILKVNGRACEEITIKPMLKSAVISSKSKPVVLLIKVPANAVKNEIIDDAVRQKNGVATGSTMISSHQAHKKTTKVAASLKENSSPEKMKLIHENLNVSNVISGESLCSEEDNKMSCCAIHLNRIEILEQEKLELQQKCSAEVLKRKDECVKKDAVISRLRRQVATLQSERNGLRKQLNAKKTLKVIPEDEISSTSPGNLNLQENRNTRSKSIPTAESLQSVDVFYANPRKKNMQDVWKESKLQAMQRAASDVSTTFAPFVDAQRMYMHREVSDVSSLGWALGEPLNHEFSGEYSSYSRDSEGLLYYDTPGQSRESLPLINEDSAEDELSVLPDMEKQASVVVIKEGGY